MVKIRRGDLIRDHYIHFNVTRLLDVHGRLEILFILDRRLWNSPPTNMGRALEQELVAEFWRDHDAARTFE